MIALDSSALVAIALSEDEADRLVQIMSTTWSLVGTPTFLETRIVLIRRVGREAALHFLQQLTEYEVEIVPLDRAMYDIAAAAFDRYGKGRGHPASLNFGDCMAYAVAKAQSLPLLYKGDDFARTDIRSAL